MVQYFIEEFINWNGFWQRLMFRFVLLFFSFVENRTQMTRIKRIYTDKYDWTHWTEILVISNCDWKEREIASKVSKAMKAKWRRVEERAAGMKRCLLKILWQDEKFRFYWGSPMKANEGCVEVRATRNERWWTDKVSCRVYISQHYRTVDRMTIEVKKNSLYYNVTYVNLADKCID